MGLDCHEPTEADQPYMGIAWTARKSDGYAGGAGPIFFSLLLVGIFVGTG
jgi:hypothetical protein